MHEFSVTSQIVKTVLDEAAKQKAKKVLEVRLAIGRLTLLGISQIRFAYKLLAKDTILEGSKLTIERKSGAVKCDKCGYEGPIKFRRDPAYHLAFPTLACPRCGYPVTIVEGRECMVKSVRLEV